MEAVREWLRLDTGSGDGSGDGSGYGYGFGFGSGDGSGYGYGFGFGSGDGSGYGYGSGDGYGSGYGDGSGDGYGSGYGDGSGDGSGYGFGFGSGDGFGFGSGYGDGSGFGSGDGFGFGSGDGSGLKMLNDAEIYLIDGVQTIIEKIKGLVAKGFIVNSNLTLQPCYVVKDGRYFAHGETLKEAQEALTAKIFENMDAEEAICKFLDTFKKGVKYPGKDFFEWHHYLTGSCKMGRESFVRNNDINLDDGFTVDEFIEICENAYGSEVIKQLKEAYEEKEE